MSAVKQLKINPAFFKLSGGQSKGKTKSKKGRKRPSVSNSLLNKSLKPNDIKKKLLQRIKEHKRNNNNNNSHSDDLEKSTVKTFQDEFKESIDYLNDVVKKKAKKKRDKTMRKRDREKRHEIIHSSPEVNIPFKDHTNKIFEKSTIPNSVIAAPPYGCLKNGNKPTYRQYKKTLKKNKTENNIQPKLVINDKPQTMLNPESNAIQRKAKLNEVREKLSSTFKNPVVDINIPEPPKKKIKKRNKTLKRKIILGKNKNSVGVLIKNKKTRRRIKRDMDVLKSTKISDIKNYLKRHNLIKIGSTAPEDVLRKMYEDSRLSGSIYNKNSEILIHNYMSDM